MNIVVKKAKDRITVKSLVTLVPLILMPFTFFMFGSIEIVIRNTIGLWFTWLDVLPTLLISFIASLFLLCFIGLVLSEKVRRYYVALIFGLGLALYVQGNLMPVSYGVLDGLPVAWDDYIIWAIVNTVIWLVLLIIPILIVRFRREISQKILIYVTVVVLFIQTGTVTYMVAQPSPQRGVDLFVSGDHMHTVSDHKNIVILILDSFDTSFMHFLLYDEPEIVEELDGFVFFENVIGMFPKTWGALPHILTGVPFLNEKPYWDYLDMAFANAPLYPMLEERNFTTFIHTEPIYISHEIKDFIGNVHEDVWFIDDNIGMAVSLYHFTGLRYFPHVLKIPIWGNPDFNKHRTSANHESMYTWDNTEFYNKMMSVGLDILPDRNVFSLLHLAGPRGSIDRFVQPTVYVNEFRNERIGGSLQIVIDYVDKLKKMNIDNNTLLIVLSDHGLTQMYQRPLLLVRDPAHRNPFTISSVPVSFENLMPMLLAYISEELTPLDYLHTAALNQSDRTFYFYLEADIRDWQTVFLPDINKYVFVDSSNCVDDARFTGTIHASNPRFRPQIYRLGNTLHFAQTHDNFTSPVGFFSRGLSSVNDEYTWSYGHESLFVTRLSRAVASDLNLEMTFLVFPDGEGQTIKLYAGERFLDEAFFPNLGEDVWQSAAFIIPKDVVCNNNVLELRFEFPDAVRPRDIWSGNEDIRLLAIGFREMTITIVD
jgi:hypothetical protein